MTGELAQMVRVTGLHPEDHKFESYIPQNTLKQFCFSL